MVVIRDRNSRGRTQIGWLDSRHSFSFGGYQDSEHTGFRALRVINEDRVIPGGGFGTHGHRDMEILSYVLSGAMEHEDSLGNGSVIRPGELQRMSAGTGITHSEFNHSDTEPLHFLQIWILPERRGLEPGYEQLQVASENRRGELRVIGDRRGTNGAVTIHQDVRVYLANLDSRQTVYHAVPQGRQVWVQLARGVVELNGDEIREGDGAAISDENTVEIQAVTPSELLLFDLA